MNVEKDFKKDYYILKITFVSWLLKPESPSEILHLRIVIINY